MLQIGELILTELDKSYFAVVQLRTQPEGVIHQVTLRPDKVKESIIRLGDTPGDEITGWQYPDNILIVEILGEAFEDESEPERSPQRWKCRPIKT